MSRRRRRWVSRAVLVGIGLVLATVGAATPAWAWCEGDPPAPKAPDSGMVGFFVVDPAVDPEVDPGDPFQDPDVSLAETYGYPYHWATYDLGCGPDATRDPASIVFTSLANVTFDAGLAAGAFAQTVQDFVYSGPLEVLNEPIESTQAAVFDKIWTVWFPVALMGVGVVVVARARRAEMSENATILMVASVVVAASIYLLTFPSRAADVADEGIGTAVETITSPFADSARVEEQMSRGIFYPAWLEGSFGSADSAVAQNYGPALFASMHYSWAEWEMINTGGLEVKERIDTTKGAAFEAIAADLKANYPGEYRVLIGKESTDRLGLASMMVLYSLSAAFVVCVGMGLILLAMLIIRAFIVAFPLAGMAGIYPQGRAALLKLWDYLAAALWCVIKFTFATALFLVVCGTLLTADMPSVMKFIVLIVMTIAVLMFARPFRTAKSMLPGLDPNHSYLMGGVNRWRRRRAHRKDDAKEDVKAKSADEDEDTDAADDPGHERTLSSREEESLPPLPPPEVITYEWGDRPQTAARADARGAEAGRYARQYPDLTSRTAALPAGTRSPRSPAERAAAVASGLSGAGARAALTGGTASGTASGAAGAGAQGGGSSTADGRTGDPDGADGPDGTTGADRSRRDAPVEVFAVTSNGDGDGRGTATGNGYEPRHASAAAEPGRPGAGGGLLHGIPASGHGSGHDSGHGRDAGAPRPVAAGNGAHGSHPALEASAASAPAGRTNGAGAGASAAVTSASGRTTSGAGRREQPVVHEVPVEPMYRSRSPHARQVNWDSVVAQPEMIMADPVIDETGNEVFMIYSRSDRV